MPLPEDVFWAGDERGIPHRMVREGDGFREAEVRPSLAAVKLATGGVLALWLRAVVQWARGR